MELNPATIIFTSGTACLYNGIANMIGNIMWEVVVNSETDMDKMGKLICLPASNPF